MAKNCNALGNPAGHMVSNLLFRTLSFRGTAFLWSQWSVGRRLYRPLHRGIARLNVPCHDLINRNVILQNVYISTIVTTECGGAVSCLLVLSVLTPQKGTACSYCQWIRPRVGSEYACQAVITFL